MPQSTRKPNLPAPQSPAIEDNPLDMTDEEYWTGARESLRHYRETGLHLTNEEVKKWMDQRARGERVPMPKLHT